MFSKKKFALGLVPLALVGATLGNPQEAEAGRYKAAVTASGALTIGVYNSADSNSGSTIEVWKNISVSGTVDYLNDGEGPSPSWYNDTNQVRVKLYDGKYDTKSYKIKPIGGSYGPCHNIAGASQVSDPPNVDYVYYKTYNRSDCINA
jgi:hypothetical protein